MADGQPLKELQELPRGWMLDRFGSPWGSFLAPAGAPYSARALPPNSLNTWPDGPEHNYNCYEVTQPVTAWVGPIAPHFEQPGGGEQLWSQPRQSPRPRATATSRSTTSSTGATSTNAPPRSASSPRDTG